MEDHRLKAFCLVVELKSFSKAAEAKFMTQSAISHLIKNLEDELGVKLLNRKGKSILLTPIGRVFYKYAKQISEQYMQMGNAINAALNEAQGTLRIGTSSTISSYLLPQVFYDFSRKFPDIHINLSTSNSENLINQLCESKLDIVIIEKKSHTAKAYSEQIADDEIVLIASEDNLLTKKRNIRPKDLISQPFIMPEIGSGTREIIDDYLVSFKIDFNKMKVLMTSADPELIIRMVQSGLGIAFVSKWSAFKSMKEGSVKLLPIGKKRLKRKIHLVFIDQQPVTMVLKTFIEFIRNYRFFIPF